jgi:hypothetical protein
MIHRRKWKNPIRKKIDPKKLKKVKYDIESYRKYYNPDLHKVHTKIQLKKMTKTGLIRLVIKLEKFIVSHAYEMYKSKLPRLRTRPQQKKLGFTEVPLSKMRGKMLHGVYVPPQHLDFARKFIKKEESKRKKLTGAAKAKFLARMNKGRRRKGLKPIRSR